MPSIAQKWQNRRRTARSRSEVYRANNTVGGAPRTLEIIANASRQTDLYA